jgi:hypothetical protein
LELGEELLEFEFFGVEFGVLVEQGFLLGFVFVVGLDGFVAASAAFGELFLQFGDRGLAFFQLHGVVYSGFFAFLDFGFIGFYDLFVKGLCCLELFLGDSAVFDLFVPLDLGELENMLGLDEFEMEFAELSFVLLVLFY